MQLKYIISALCVSLSYCANAQTIRDVFTSMPDTIISILTHNDRLDLLDYAEANNSTPVKNRFGGSCTIDKMTDKYLHLHLTSQTDVTIKIMDYNGTKAVCLIRTSAIDNKKDSHVSFYSTAWKPMPAAYSLLPKDVQDKTNDFVEVVLNPDSDVFVVNRIVDKIEYK